MVVSTALMLGGALAGGAGGGIANGKRIKEQQDELDILNMKTRQNLEEQQAAVRGLRNTVKMQSMEASQGARKDAISAYQQGSSMSAAAGASGIQGGTPFYKMGQVAAEAAQTLQENAAMRAAQIQNTEDQGASEITGIKTNGMILDKQYSNAETSMSYLSSPLGWAQSILTGAVSGAEMGAKLSMGLEAVGVDTGADIPGIGDLIKNAQAKKAAATAYKESGGSLANAISGNANTGGLTLEEVAKPLPPVIDSTNDLVAKGKLGKGVDPSAALIFSLLGSDNKNQEKTQPDYGDMIDTNIYSISGYTPKLSTVYDYSGVSLESREPLSGITSSGLVGYNLSLGGSRSPMGQGGDGYSGTGVFDPNYVSPSGTRKNKVVPSSFNVFPDLDLSL